MSGTIKKIYNFMQKIEDGLERVIKHHIQCLNMPVKAISVSIWQLDNLHISLIAEATRYYGIAEYDDSSRNSITCSK